MASSLLPRRPLESPGGVAAKPASLLPFGPPSIGSKARRRRAPAAILPAKPAPKSLTCRTCFGTAWADVVVTYSDSMNLLTILKSGIFGYPRQDLACIIACHHKNTTDDDVVSTVSFGLGQAQRESIDFRLHFLGEMSRLNLGTRKQCYWRQSGVEGALRFLLHATWLATMERAASVQCPPTAL